jgi:hypothetical protein
MRVLNFRGKTKEYYNIIYEGLTATTTRGAETRLLGKIFIKLEECGELLENAPLYRINVDSATIALEEAEFDLLKRLFDTVGWNGVGAKMAAEVMGWLEAIPQENLKVEK